MHKHFVNADRKEVKNEGQVDSWYIEDDHPAIVSKKLWQRAQDAVAKKREYLAESSIVGVNEEKTYPYKFQLYCDKCGYALYHRVYSKGNRVCWCCSGQKRYKTKFCTGINIPDSVIRSWKEMEGNIYIRKVTDAIGKSSFEYSKEIVWMRNHNKKAVPEIVEMNDVNFPYRKKIYCKECGSRLVRWVEGSGTIKWICNGYKRKGVEFCSGIRIPDQVIRGWDIETNIYVEGKDGKHGEKNYSYTSKTGTRK